MAGSLFSMTNLARIAKVLALLLFLLPWVTVSCSPQALGPAAGSPPAMMSGAGDVILIEATGMQLATATATPNNPNPQAASPPPNPFAAPDYLVLGGALLILLALAASFALKGSKGPLAAAAGSAASAALLCYALLVEIPRLVHGAFASSAGAMGPSPIDAAELARVIKVETQIGFWLTILALAAAVALNILAMRGAPPAAAPAPATPPTG
jgi:hypothetical protein